MPRILNMLCPQAALNAQDVRGVGLGNTCCQRVEGIDFLQGQMTSHGAVLIGVLVMVQITVM
jgi:hypothetical protein